MFTSINMGNIFMLYLLWGTKNMNILIIGGAGSLLDAVVSNALAEVLPTAKLQCQKSTWKSIFDTNTDFLTPFPQKRASTFYKENRTYIKNQRML
jgi:thiamine pyrophosphokinase